MKLKSSMKWAIAAAATVTTVTVSMGVIANAYTYKYDETSGGGYGILGDDKVKIGKDNFREGYDFEFSKENSALKQAVRFKLSVDIKDFNATRDFPCIPAQATISFGGYDENGNKVEIGQLVKNEAYSGDLEYSLDNDKMASGKFWMELENKSYSSIEFKSIKFYDKDDHCILYGCAQELYWDEDNWKNYGQWTFYQLIGPRPIITGIQNDDGTYAMNAEVVSGGLAMSVETSNDAKSDICKFELSNAVQIFTMNGADVTGKQQLTFNSAEGANNEYKFVSGASVVLKDTRNLDADGKPTEIELYSVGTEQTVKIEKMKIEAGEPQLLGELPTISYGDYKSADELLEALNNATRDKNFDAPNVEGAFVDSSVTDDTALSSRALITSTDGSRKVIAKVVYDEVSGFDPVSHKAQTITLKAHVKANDIEFKDGTVRFEKEMNCSADYIDSVKISKQPRTDYGYHEDLDLSGGELTITYNSGDTETVPMTDARVSAGGFYGANGEFPAYNSEVEVTVTYTAEDGVYDPARADGAKFSETFTVSIRDLSKLDAPVITPNGGTFRGSVEVSITAQEGATIFYTIDGSDPTANSIKYTAPFTITQGTTVKAVAIKENCHDSEIATAEFTRRSGGSGGSGGIHTRPVSQEFNWDDTHNYLIKLPDNSTANISLSGNTTVPEKVVGVIKDKKLTVEFVYDSVKSWVIHGENVSTASVAELAISNGNADRSSLRGVFGIDLKVDGTNVPAQLKLNFRDAFAEQFANVYKMNDGVLQFHDCVKVGKDGSVIISGTDAAVEYVVMVCEFSDLPGDADNDGTLSALDSSAILKQIVGKAKSANSVMCDFDGNGNVNAMDASAILKRMACLI